MVKIHVSISKSAHRKILAEKQKIKKNKGSSKRLANKKLDFAYALDKLLKNV
jgi:hypothetical protein